MAYSHGTGGHVLASTPHGIAWHGIPAPVVWHETPRALWQFKGMQASRWHLHTHLLSGMHCMGVRGGNCMND